MGESLTKLKRAAAASLEFAEQRRALGNKLAEKEAALASAEPEALRAEALGESGWQKKRDSADKLRDQVRALRGEVEKAEALVRACEAETRALQPAVIEEITAAYRAKYGAALAELWKKLKAAAAAEKELLEIQRAADQEINTHFHGPQRAGLAPTGRPNLSLLSLPGEPDSNSPLVEFEARCRMNGYELD